MYSGKIITLNVWLMILFNILLSFGAVWSFQRMDPEIKQIYERNVRSLSACEDMLIAVTGNAVDTEKFNAALQIAEHNITEPGEEQTVRQLRSFYLRLITGETSVLQPVIREIITLTNYNKQAIMESARRTQRMRRAGAWGIVFMTLIFFTVAIFFEQRMRRTLLAPLQEITVVMQENMRGNKFRRCNLLHASDDMRKLFSAINDMLDRCR